MKQARLAPQAPAARAPREKLTLGRKPAAAPPPIAAPPVPANDVPRSVPQVFPLRLLRRAPENVRHTRIDEACEEMADDIDAHGLLQSLIGYLDGEYVEIVGGGRRLKGCRILKARGRIDDDFPVPVLIRDREEAEELSLAENLQQKTMSPVDEFFGFAKLMKRGDTSPGALAKRFGWTERLVRQRLRLAELAKPVLDALADRQITLDAAMAYATSQDKALQADVFEVQTKRGRTAHDPAGVRHSLRMKGVDTADRLYRFVGAEKYEREGGRYEDDLFVEAGKDRVLAQPFLVETIADGMVDFQAMRLLDELRRDERWSPAITGFVKVPDLRLHDFGTAQPMRPPAGFVLVERAESDKLWRTIRNNGFNVHVVVGIDDAGELAVARRYAFVPAGQKTAVEKPALVEVAADRERGAAAEREREIIRWSRRLAVPPTAGTPLEGRAFWPTPGYDHQVPETIDDRRGFLVSMMVFVSDGEIAAQRKAAAAEVDRRIAAREQAGAAA